MFAPEAQLVLLLARRPRVQRLVQTQLAEITEFPKNKTMNRLVNNFECCHVRS